MIGLKWKKVIGLKWKIHKFKKRSLRQKKLIYTLLGLQVLELGLIAALLLSQRLS